MNPPEIAHTSPSTSSQLDAKGLYLNDNKFVVLDRAHTLLLMSDNLPKPMVKLPSMKWSSRQKIDMKKNEEEGYNQTPEARNTLQKNLILPLSISNQTLYRAMVINPRKNL